MPTCKLNDAARKHLMEEAAADMIHVYRIWGSGLASTDVGVLEATLKGEGMLSLTSPKDVKDIARIRKIWGDRVRRINRRLERCCPFEGKPVRSKTLKPLTPCVCRAEVREVVTEDDGSTFTAYRCSDCGLTSPMASNKMLARDLWETSVKALSWAASK